MRPKTVISNWQAIVLTIFANSSVAVLFIPTVVAIDVKQDGWIAIILATFLSGLLLYYPLSNLGMRYPGKTIIEYSEIIMGKFLGKIFGVLLIFSFFQIHCWTLRIFGDLVTTLLPETPMEVFIISFALIVAYAAYNGLEVIGRCSEFVFPIGILSLSIIALSNYANMDFSNLLPVMESSIPQLTKATITPFGWLTTGFIFGIITSFVNSQADLKKIGLIAIGIGGFILTIFTIISFMVLGVPVLSIANFPLLTLARLSNVPVFERIEILIIMFWTTWICIRAALFSYATTVGLSQLFNLADYRFLIFPETIFAIAYSIFQYDNMVEMSYIFSIADVYYLFYFFGIPFTLWVVSKVRN